MEAGIHPFLEEPESCIPVQIILNLMDLLAFCPMERIEELCGMPIGIKKRGKGIGDPAGTATLRLCIQC